MLLACSPPWPFFLTAVTPGVTPSHTCFFSILNTIFSMETPIGGLGSTKDAPGETEGSCGLRSSVWGFLSLPFLPPPPLYPLLPSALHPLSSSLPSSFLLPFLLLFSSPLPISLKMESTGLRNPLLILRELLIELQSSVKCLPELTLGCSLHEASNPSDLLCSMLRTASG